MIQLFERIVTVTMGEAFSRVFQVTDYYVVEQVKCPIYGVWGRYRLDQTGGQDRRRSKGETIRSLCYFSNRENNR